MWRFNVTNNRWTWVAGGATTNSAGVYGTKNIASSSNMAGSRSLLSMVADENDLVYIFGGIGRGTSTAGKSTFFFVQNY